MKPKQLCAKIYIINRERGVPGGEELDGLGNNKGNKSRNKRVIGKNGGPGGRHWERQQLLFHSNFNCWFDLFNGDSFLVIKGGGQY